MGTERVITSCVSERHAAQRCDAPSNLGQAGRGRPPRIAIYSHDTMGVGHMRRNLLISQSVIQSTPNSTVLMIAGAKEANAFAVPQGVDCLTLPSLRKDLSGTYHSRRLMLPLRDLIEIRGAAIQAAVGAYEPDLLIVDKVPRGVGDELLPTLRNIRERGTTHCVLGLREVLDGKRETIENWHATQTLDVVRDYFEEIWIYGDPRVFNLVEEYELPEEIASRVQFMGYLNQRRRAAFDGPLPSWADLPRDPFVLCVVGGGQDGARLAIAFAEAVASTRKQAVLVCGPFMPDEARGILARHAAETPHLRIVDFVPEADWLMSRAERVISMGGYNTACSILSFGKPALVVPRVRPRQEQLIRARRFSERGLISMLHPRQLSPAALCAWMEDNHLPSPLRCGEIDLNGLTAIHESISRLTTKVAGTLRVP